MHASDRSKVSRSQLFFSLSNSLMDSTGAFNCIAFVLSAKNNNFTYVNHFRAAWQLFKTLDVNELYATAIVELIIRDRTTRHHFPSRKHERSLYWKKKQGNMGRRQSRSTMSNGHILRSKNRRVRVTESLTLHTLVSSCFRLSKAKATQIMTGRDFL
jgi:hypothetical protein